MPHRTYQRWNALLLGGVGGAVEVIGYLTFSRLFMGAISGNTVLLGLHLGQGQWGEVLRYGFPILLFSVGTLTGLLLSRKSLVPALLVEAALLLAALTWQVSSPDFPLPPASWDYFPRVALLSAAMGVQNGALRQAGGASLHTTYVTWDLTNLIVRLGSVLTHSAHPKASDPKPARKPATEQPGFLLALWGIYILGAVAGAFAVKFYPREALLFPLFLLCAVLALTLSPRASQA